MWPFKHIKRERPRKKTPHHYWFAHVVLRTVCFCDPCLFLGKIASPARQEFLDDLWRVVCQTCDKHGEADFSSRDIKITISQIGDYPAILIQMPTPHFTTEAHMVCIILKTPIEEIETIDSKLEVRYFTLEKGVNMMTGGDRTVLCAWEEDDRHNYGDGPEPTPQAFVEAITKLI